jgi:hypothetical protein
MGGKGRALSANISQELRDALDAEAERTGRSISQITERWLDAASKGNAAYVDLLGGEVALAAAVEKLVKIARAVYRNDDVEPDLRHIALLAAWRASLPLVVPREAVGAVDVELATRQRRVEESRIRALEVIEAAPENDPVRLRLHEPMEPRAGGPSLYDRIMDAERNFDITSELKELLAAGETAQTEAKAALVDQSELLNLVRGRRSRMEEAERIGEDVAVAHKVFRRFPGLEAASE